MSTTADITLRTYNSLALERKGRLLTIALNRPDALNAVNNEMHEELSECLQLRSPR
jgi:enoyl-CoA hydratase